MTEQRLQVVQVTKSNVDDLMAMLRGLAEYHGQDVPDLVKSARLRADLLGDDPPFEAYVAMRDSEAVGCLTLDKRYSTYTAERVLFMGDLYVDGAQRRAGIGETLLEFAKGRARELGCTALEWNMVRENESARPFYSKNGAAEWGNILVWYRIIL
ncbi:MAG: GNAT family N-acetyltransferase [Chloroflexi bacterium]|nr:GNAT family N-acetyltransferase [Chloroflexota bacterium]MDA1174826.1 GNAT family N-acetyltransferase [Chloroflexota bacterium]